MSVDYREADPTELLLAELTEAAYTVVLQHGFEGSFVDVELALWRQLRRVLEREREEASCPA